MVLRWLAGTGVSEKYQLLKTSLTYQTQLYFDNSTLHGVRYIREKGRPFSEKFLWFACTTIGGVVCVIIIMSLWDKFQTNPTITGLDTDTHNWDVPFPAVSLCLNSIADEKAVDAYVMENHGGDKLMKEFFMEVANFSYVNLAKFERFDPKEYKLPTDVSLADLQVKFARKCEDVIKNCVYTGLRKDCCPMFQPQLTEVGFCYAFNSRHVFKPNASFVKEYIRETDDTLSISFEITVYNDNLSVEAQQVKMYLYSSDEIPSIDYRAQLIWKFRIENLFFSEKYTYTTAEARQLSIRQRRCVFPDEIALDTDRIYTYTACMTQCRMRLARKYCGCVPFIYKKIDGYPHCNAQQLRCLAEHAAELSGNNQCHCDLGCMNTRYEVERLQDLTRFAEKLELSFVSWPMLRYKREVLFGWLDLLVSFGGIAGLFLGFSLLSGVEVIYYFTMRACCMVYHDEEELKQLQEEYNKEERPPLDLSLTPYFMNKNDQFATHDWGDPGLTKIHPTAGDYKDRLVQRQPHAKATHGPVEFIL